MRARDNDAHTSGTEKSEPVAENSWPVMSSRFKPEDLSIDDIMSRVRLELARRNRYVSATGSEVPVGIGSFDESAPKWTPAVPRLPVKDAYLAAELLAFSDADFIDVAYRCV